MPDWFSSLTDGFMPHGFCLRWNGPLLFAFIAGNVGIALAYFLIPVALQRFIGKRQDLPYPYMFKLFAAFILSCGLTHLAKIWTLYQPAYWVEASIDLWTAAVSLLTAALLYPLIPQALQLRSPKELEAANAKLEQQIIETNKAKAEAEAARDEAINANKLKSQFVATISHEIRTPMSGVIGMAELITQDPTSTDVPALSLRLYDASKNLLSVLNDLLDFSKLEAGKVSVDPIEFAPRKLISDVTGLVSTNVNAKKLTLETHLDQRLPDLLYGDAAKVRQILINFLHNAIKFTQKGQIDITVEVIDETSESATLKFSVADTGIGITPEIQALLFQPFVQGDARTSRLFGGTGLGLSIAKQYVDLLKGQIAVKSAPAEGSIFSFTASFQRIN